MSLSIGQELGHYQVVEQLGEGGMATVYKALDLRLDRHVAIKVIRRDALVKPDFLARFEREAKALAHLSHPHIVKILDYGEVEGAPYVVMEYFPGGTLKDKLGSPLPWAEAARLLAPIASALYYAHQHKIIHRDVKPANVLISDSGQVMLSDFGIAKVLEDSGATALTATGVGIGTPAYMAPEQGQGKPITCSADIYALGVVFYEMITGRQPYQADTPMAVVLKHVNDPLPPPHDIIDGLPEDVEKAIFRAMAKDPRNRYPSMGEFAAALERISRYGMAAGPLIEAQGKAGALPQWAIYGGIVLVVGIVAVLCISLGLAGALGLPGVFGGSRTKEVSIMETGVAGTMSAGEPTIALPAVTLKPTVAPTAAPRGVEPITAANAGSVSMIGRFFGRVGSNYRYSPDGRFLSGGSSEIYLYDAQTLAEIRSLKTGSGVTELVFSPDGSLLATSQGDKTLVQLWQTSDGKLLRVLEGHTGQVTGLAFSPDGSRIATASVDMLAVWQVSDGLQVYKVAPMYGAPTVAFSPDGSLLAVSGYENLIIKLLKASDGSPVRQLSGSWAHATSVAFSPDGSLLVAASGGDRTSVWNTQSGSRLFYLEDPAPTVQYVLIDQVAFSPDGSLLVTGGGDNLIRLWDPSNGALLRTLEGNTQMIQHVSFSPDGRVLAVEAVEMLMYGIQ